MILKEGSIGPLVGTLQDYLEITVDNSFGPNTKKAVIAYQKKNRLVPDGIVGTRTWDTMGLATTDAAERIYTTKGGLQIHQHFLPKGEFIKGPISNDYAFIHHTAGWNNPYKVIDSWGRDDRGRVATEFVLGGQKITDGEDSYDGEMVQAFPEGCQGWHLGKVGSDHMRRHSVALEICSFGYLADGKTYVGTKAHKSQISKLKEPFRGYDQWHAYSDAQLIATREWILFIAERDNIDVREGLIAWLKELGPNKAFEFNEDAYYGKVKGLLTHTNVRKDKWDNFPQPELCDMLLTI
jgi:Putative peptidoglycan binding domain